MHPLTLLLRAQVWDARRRNFLHTITLKYQVTATCFGGRDDTVIVGGLDNTIHVYDLRNLSEVITLQGHTGARPLLCLQSPVLYKDLVGFIDVFQSCVLCILHFSADTITGLRLSPDGTQLLSNAMDNTGGLRCLIADACWSCSDFLFGHWVWGCSDLRAADTLQCASGTCSRTRRPIAS